MTPQILIRNLAFGFLPLLAYILADSFFTSHYGDHLGTRYALIFAIGLGLFQALFVYIRERRFDKMVLFDTLLLLLLGGVSLFSGNDLFFKLKPAIAEGLMAVLLFVVAFFKPRLLLLLVGRLAKEMTFTDAHLHAMQWSARGLFALVTVHATLVTLSALFMSKEAWAFISGPLFYLLCGLYFAMMVLYRKWKTAHTPLVRHFTYTPSRPRIRKP